MHAGANSSPASDEQRFQSKSFIARLAPSFLVAGAFSGWPPTRDPPACPLHRFEVEITDDAR